jgi:5'-methylthioadenosine phosphorylase
MAKEIIRNAVAAVQKERSCPCASAMQYAIITSPSVIPRETKDKLAPIVGKYLK